ncbi:hypothetical protein BOX15_Mlig008083g1, partial [Macrostomum lignano]
SRSAAISERELHRLFERARRCYVLGKYDEATNLAESVLADWPNDKNSIDGVTLLELRRFLADAYIDYGEDKAAEEHALKYVELASASDNNKVQQEAWLTLGRVYLMLDYDDPNFGKAKKAVCASLKCLAKMRKQLRPQDFNIMKLVTYVNLVKTCRPNELVARAEFLSVCDRLVDQLGRDVSEETLLVHCGSKLEHYVATEAVADGFEFARTMSDRKLLDLSADAALYLSLCRLAAVAADSGQPGPVKQLSRASLSVFAQRGLRQQSRLPRVQHQSVVRLLKCNRLLAKLDSTGSGAASDAGQLNAETVGAHRTAGDILLRFQLHARASAHFVWLVEQLKVDKQRYCKELASAYGSLAVCCRALDRKEQANECDREKQLLEGSPEGNEEGDKANRKKESGKEEKDGSDDASSNSSSSDNDEDADGDGWTDVSSGVTSGMSDFQVGNEGRQPRSRNSRPMEARKNEFGDTPLHLAAQRGDINRARQLVEVHGHSVSVVDNNNWQPVHDAATHGHINVIEYLLERGVPVDTPGCRGSTALLEAVSSGHFEAAKWLIERGANPARRDADGDNILSLAEAWRHDCVADGQLAASLTANRFRHWLADRLGEVEFQRLEKQYEAAQARLKLRLAAQEARAGGKSKDRRGDKDGNKDRDGDRRAGVESYKATMRQVRRSAVRDRRHAPKPAPQELESPYASDASNDGQMEPDAGEDSEDSSEGPAKRPRLQLKQQSSGNRRRPMQILDDDDIDEEVREQEKGQKKTPICLSPPPVSAPSAHAPAAESEDCNSPVFNRSAVAMDRTAQHRRGLADASILPFAVDQFQQHDQPVPLLNSTMLMPAPAATVTSPDTAPAADPRIARCLRDAQTAGCLTAADFRLGPDGALPLLTCRPDRLTRLDLSGNLLTDLPSPALASLVAWQGSASLSDLNLAGNDLTSATLSELPAMPSLRVLDLSENPLGDSAGPHIGRLVSGSPKLDWLLLRDCRLTDKFGRPGLLSSDSVRLLDLDGNLFSDNGVSLLIDCVINWRQLDTLRLRRCQVALATKYSNAAAVSSAATGGCLAASLARLLQRPGSSLRVLDLRENGLKPGEFAAAAELIATLLVS